MQVYIKRVLCLLLFISWFQSIKSQNKEITFLASCPEKFYSSRSAEYPYLTTLLKLNNNNLSVVDTLVGKSKSVLNFFQVYHDLGFAIGSIGQFWDGKDSIVLLDIGTGKIDKIIAEEDIVTYRNLLILNGELWYYIFKDYESENRVLKAIDPNANLSIINSTDFINIYCNGRSGGTVSHMDYFTVYTNKNDGKLRIPRTLKIEDRPIFPIELPDNLQLKKKELLLVPVNNDKLFVIELGTNASPESKEIGWSDIAVYNKGDKKWTTRKIKGDYLSVISFGEWLCGTSISYKQVTFPMSGKKFRNQELTEYGLSFDFSAELMGFYYPGILYIFHPESNVYLEWQPMEGDEVQADSEILLLDDNIVYYRVNDGIYMRPIIDGDALGERKLLIKDFRVPYIHWAYISGGLTRQRE